MLQVGWRGAEWALRGSGVGSGSSERMQESELRELLDEPGEPVQDELQDVEFV